ncbi:coiled-coil domain-containing protein 191 isoform X2 [Octodon degus]|uniref:Coiled-coil domain-containing protein 191 isoform X2 n=1 Tax=Octodon degus TaxID=10160 RepID=A0A6P6EM71_OCTDE|nr:coiled-coil domain-containing protein 191 isoform X2 [Octodon degus]
MLLSPKERSTSGKNKGVNRWKRFTRKPNPKPAFDPDNVEYWIKRVELASEFAVSHTFFARNSDLPGRCWGQMIDLETPEQIENHDEVYTEAQELVSDWLGTKLQQELASDGEEDAENTVSSVTPRPEASSHWKYDRFDDLCSYLEEEEESTTVQKFVDHLLHKKVVDSGMLDDLGMKENQDKKQQKDPRLTMEMRHKQVKENRLRREKELECWRMEKVLKKSAFLEAQYLVQEEKKRKALEAKKEKEEIQREMVKLRREILERRHTVEEAWKTEKKKQEENLQKNPDKGMFPNASVLLDEEKVAKEKKKKLKELLIQTFKENHQCQKRYFSAWHRLIADRRIELGKAGTLSNWKLQLKVLRAWRDYTRSQKLEQATQALENDLREENRKQQLATEYNRKQVLRHCFAEWQRWCGAQALMRELALAKQETRRKMDELLKAASLGRLSTPASSGIRLLETPATEVLPVRDGEETVMPSLGEQKPLKSGGCMFRAPLRRTANGNLQGPLQNVPQNTPDSGQQQALNAELIQRSGSDKQLGTASQKAEPVYMGHLHHRHVFQQQLIEKQKKKLQEQQKTILELKEHQRLTEARWAAERAAALREARKRLWTSPSGAEELKGTSQMLLNSSVTSLRTRDSRSNSQNSLSGPRMKPKLLMAPHPILKAMEERAIHRAERRRILAEKKKQQEEEKLALLKAQEEEQQKREEEAKEAQLEKKREERRLKKMKELEKQKRIQRNKELEAAAKEQYKKILLRKKGLEPWKKLRQQSRQNTQYVTDLEEEARELCVHFLLKKIFRTWFLLVREAKTASQSKHEVAVGHHDRKMLRIAFQTWTKFVKLMKEERVKEERREQLRRRVAEILPDFQMLAPL